MFPTSPQRELRPRLCTMKKGPNGYGFNLHSDKSKPGQFIRAVDPDSPAEASGLRAQDRIVEVIHFTVFSMFIRIFGALGQSYTMCGLSNPWEVLKPEVLDGRQLHRQIRGKRRKGVSSRWTHGQADWLLFPSPGFCFTSIHSTAMIYLPKSRQISARGHPHGLLDA